MNNSQIVECIHRDYDLEITNYIKSKLFHKEYCDDLKQEIYLSLLTRDNSLLNSLYFTTGVIFYIKRMVINQLTFNRSIFNKTRLMSNDLIVPDSYDDVEDDEYIDKDLLINKLRMDIIMDITSEQKFFIQLYLYKLRNNLTYIQIGSDLNINVRTLQYQFQLIRERIIDSFDNF